MQSIGHDRREFISKSFCLAGTASLAAFGVRRAAAQVQGTLPPIQRSQRYDDSFITRMSSLPRKENSVYDTIPAQRKPSVWLCRASVLV